MSAAGDGHGNEDSGGAIQPSMQDGTEAGEGPITQDSTTPVAPASASKVIESIDDGLFDGGKWLQRRFFTIQSTSAS